MPRHETAPLLHIGPSEQRMRSKTLHLASLLTIVFLVLLVAATLATRGTKASPGTLYVSTDGFCGENIPCYSNVQEALNAANPFDEIRVAEGTYTDTAGTVVEIAESITLQGGWNAGFTVRAPDLYTTTLDAQGLGRVIQIDGTISPTIEGFIITGGNASNEAFVTRLGGGIYSRNADPIIQNNVITNNIASTSTVYLGNGGGLYLQGASASAVVSGNLILSNTASTGHQGRGGGLCLASSDATISGNTVQGNKASISNVGWGGGLYLSISDATLSGNTISGNTAALGSGGGLWLYDSKATLDGNSVISNTASDSGGGLYVTSCAPFTLTNNIIAQNESNNLGGGISVWDSGGTLINNTIAQNNLGSGKEGVYAFGTTTLTLTNNIVVSHTYGIAALGNATVAADYTLFYDNTIGDTYGTGTITSTNETTGDPLFVDPAGWDYHIQIASPAVNKGTFSGAPSTDFEGDPRPYDCFVDIGADENMASGYCKRVYLPVIMKNY